MAGAGAGRAPAAGAGAAEDSRWRHLADGSWLAIRVLPLVAIAAVAKTVLHVVGAEPLEVNALLSGIVAANVFLLGFMLAGTLADFKEAERLPGDLAASLESIADECLIVQTAKRDPLSAACVRHLRDLARGVELWLGGARSHDQVMADVRGLNHFFLGFEPLTQPAFIGRMKAQQYEASRILLRMDAIRRTSFVTAGYLIARVATWLVLIALVLTDTGPLSEGLFFVVVIAFVLIYMNRLIRDLDNPFEYRYGVRGTADVSLEMIEQAGRRLDRALSSVGDRPASPV